MQINRLLGIPTCTGIQTSKKKLQAECNIRKEIGAMINAMAVRKVSNHFEYLENRPSGLDVTLDSRAVEILLHISEQSPSCEASLSAVRCR
jgi:hypothetical protein